MKSSSIPYLAKFKSLHQREGYTFNLLVNSLEFESGVHERLALFEDILTENETNLKQIFKEERDLDVLSISYSEMVSLPVQTIKENASVFQTVFNNALQGSYKERGGNAIKNITSLFDDKKAGLTVVFLLGIIEDHRLDIEYKAKLVRTISEVDDLASIFNWEGQDLGKHNFIIPGYMYFYRNSNPAKALDALLHMKKENLGSLLDFLYFPVEKVIFSLAVIHNNPDHVNVVRGKLKLILPEIDDIITEYIATNSEVKQLVEEAGIDEQDIVVRYIKGLHTKKSYEKLIMGVLETSYDDDY